MKKIYLFLCLITPLLTGCTNKTGNQFLEKTSDAELSSKLTKNKTTKEEVKNLYGDPVDFDLRNNGKEVWTYKHMVCSLNDANGFSLDRFMNKGVGTMMRELKIFFNKEGILEHYILAAGLKEGKTIFTPEK